MNGLVLTIWKNELLRLVRDRRAFLMAVVLPVLLFPAMFVLLPSFQGLAEDSLDEEEATVWVHLASLSPALEARVLTALEEFEEPLVLQQEPDFRGTPWSEIAAATFDPEAFEEGCDALLLANLDGTGLDLVVHGSRTLSSEARRRVQDALEALILADRESGLLATLGTDPGAPLELDTVDLAPPDDTLGLSVGKLLPFLAIFLLISAGSFAALDTFAGERESGTLETILVQPVPALQLAWGKFLCVATIAAVAFLGNAAGLFACVALGLGEFGAAEVGNAGLSPVRIAAALAVYAPTVLLMAAVLTWVSARARSFREGQNAILPLMLLSIAPAALATQDRVELDLVLGAIPIAGASLAMRDALTGSLTLGLAAWTFLCSAGFAALALRGVANTLDAERVLSARAPGSDGHDGVRFRRALSWGVAVVLVVYVVGGRLQSWQLAQGLAITLWILVPSLAIAIALDLRRRTGESVARTLLGPRAPHPAHLLGAVACAPLIAWLAIRWFTWQQTWLPAPEGGAEGLDLDFGGPTWRFLLLAASPAIFEELLFRGALLRSMGTTRPRRVLVAQSLLFAAVHASVFRFVPTGVLGGLAAGIALRTGSTLPAILFHGTYNGLLIGLEGDLPTTWLPAMGGAFVLGVGLFSVGRRPKG